MPRPCRPPDSAEASKYTTQPAKPRPLNENNGATFARHDGVTIPRNRVIVPITPRNHVTTDWTGDVQWLVSDMYPFSVQLSQVYPSVKKTTITRLSALVSELEKRLELRHVMPLHILGHKGRNIAKHRGKWLPRVLDLLQALPRHAQLPLS
jgi:hypothetical protein